MEVGRTGGQADAGECGMERVGRHGLEYVMLWHDLQPGWHTWMASGRYACHCDGYPGLCPSAESSVPSTKAGIAPVYSGIRCKCLSPSHTPRLPWVEIRQKLILPWREKRGSMPYASRGLMISWLEGGRTSESCGTTHRLRVVRISRIREGISGSSTEKIPKRRFVQRKGNS